MLAYRGSLSYAFEEAGDALNSLFRILRSGGVVVASVMSRLGAWHYFLKGTTAIGETFAEDANDAVLQNGDLRLNGDDHICQLYRTTDVDALVKSCSGEVLTPLFPPLCRLSYFAFTV